MLWGRAQLFLTNPRIISLRAQISQNVKYLYEICDVLVPIFHALWRIGTNFSQSVWSLRNVKFAVQQCFNIYLKHFIFRQNTGMIPHKTYIQHIHDIWGWFLLFLFSLFSQLKYAAVLSFSRHNFPVQFSASELLFFRVYTNLDSNRMFSSTDHIFCKFLIIKLIWLLLWKREYLSYVNMQDKRTIPFFIETGK